MREHRHDHAGAADPTALYERIARRLGIPHAARSGKGSSFTAAEIARHLTWLDQAERAELQLARSGSWAHDANRLLALRQARELACELARRQPPAHRPTFSPSRGSFPPAHGGQAH